MTTAALFMLQESPVEFDPPPLGPFERLIVITLFVMACWIAVAVLHTLWGRVRRRDPEPARICRRIRNLRLIGQTAPLIGLLGTTTELIAILRLISFERLRTIEAVSGEVAHVLRLTVLGLVVGIAAYFASAFVERGKPVE